MQQYLKIKTENNIQAENGGCFVSREAGRHPTRIINSYELILVCNGCLSIYEENREFEVQKDNFLILWPSREHGGIRNYKANLSFYWIHFHVSATEEEESQIKIPQTGRLRQAERLETLFRRFLNDQEEGLLSATEANLLMSLMLCETTKTANEKLPPDSPASFLSEEAMTLIKTNFKDNNLSTLNIANQIGCNPDYLSRLFHKVYGVKVTEQIQRTRIKEARRLLLHSDLYVEEVAERSGFNHTSYFRRIFKSVCGITPSKYRRLYLRKHINTT